MLEGMIHILRGLCLWEKKVILSQADKASKAVMLDFIANSLESLEEMQLEIKTLEGESDDKE